MIGFPAIWRDEMLPPRIQTVRSGCRPVNRISPSPASSVVQGPSSWVATCSSQVPSAACSLLARVKVAVQPALGSGQLQATFNGAAAGDDVPPDGGAGATVIGGGTIGGLATCPNRDRLRKAGPATAKSSTPNARSAARFVWPGRRQLRRVGDDGEALGKRCGGAHGYVGATGGRLGTANDALGPVARGVGVGWPLAGRADGTERGPRGSEAWWAGDRAGSGRGTDGYRARGSRRADSASDARRTMSAGTRDGPAVRKLVSISTGSTQVPSISKARSPRPLPVTEMTETGTPAPVAVNAPATQAASQARFARARRCGCRPDQRVPLPMLTRPAQCLLSMT